MKAKNKGTQNIRPEILPFFVAFFIIGLKFSQLFAADYSILFFFVAFGALIASSLLHEKPAMTRFFVAMAIIFSGLFYGNLRICPEVNSGELRLFDQSQGSLTGIFSGEYRQYKSGAIGLRLRNAHLETASQTIAIPGSVFCQVKNAETIPEPEQKYRVTGHFLFSPNLRQPRFKAISIEHLSNRSALHAFGGKVQRRLRDGLNMVLPTRHAAIATGFLLGDTSRLDRHDRQLFRETGVSHLLAVSGQHLMVLSMVLAAMLHLTRVPPVSRSIFICLFLVAYAFLTTGSASIIRALTMYIVTAFVFHFEAAPSSIRPLSIAALIILLYDPAQIMEPAFIFSFGAVAGIILLRRMFEQLLMRLKLGKTLARYIGVTAAANIAVMPLSAMFFGAFSLIAILVNPAIVWMFSIILPAGFLVGAVAAFSPEYGLFLAPGLSLPLEGMLYLLEWAQNLPGAYVYLGNLPGIAVAIFYAGLLTLAGRWNRSKLPSATSSTARPNDNLTDAARSTNAGSQIREPQIGAKAAVGKYSAGPDHVAITFNREQTNPFKDPELIRSLDGILLSCKRRSLKSTVPAGEVDFNPQLLSLENQNLFYQLLDLDRKVLNEENYRLIQAQIFLLALAGGEILARISTHLRPPPDPADFNIDFVVKDRFLAMALLGDRLLASSLLTRTSNQHFMLLMSRGQSLFSRARSQLQRFVKRNDAEMLEQHFALRRDLLSWLNEFLEFDHEYRKTASQEPL